VPGGSRGIDPLVAYRTLYRKKLLSLLAERWALVTGGVPEGAAGPGYVDDRARRTSRVLTHLSA
jgi:hypothetical protein